VAVEQADKLLAGLPRAQGSAVQAPGLSRSLLEVFQRATDLAGELGDEYVSTEHLVVGWPPSPDPRATHSRPPVPPHPRSVRRSRRSAARPR
jgi:ATP-dependent Clp protease ATP-binding subunit ClpB